MALLGLLYGYQKSGLLSELYLIPTVHIPLFIVVSALLSFLDFFNLPSSLDLYPLYYPVIEHQLPYECD